ncbi:MAG: hypothetical protein IKV33_01260 [Alistipes sp.]|nr:hypothetical protein [Alistipes sp.]
MIPKELKERFEKVIEIKNINWASIDAVVQKDANILRPIKGIAFEEYLKKIIKRFDSNIKIEDGVGDSDVDLYVNGIAIQAKTQVSGVTKDGVKIGVALHKTHGDETAPSNLYSTVEPTFDILCVQHPDKGVLIIPFDQIALHRKWENRLADPAYFPWDSEWLNRWDLLKMDIPAGTQLDTREVPKHSELPFLSSQTYLEDYEIVEMLCKPEYFRAAVMGLKGNMKEEIFIQHLKDSGINVNGNIPTYSPFDALIYKGSNEYKVQIKGTSKNMCKLRSNEIGTEVMGTHGQFPVRGYKQSSIDYVAIIISADQLPPHESVKEVNFIIIPATDLPLHYLIGEGDDNIQKGWGNYKWNLTEFADVLYPNLKFKYNIEDRQIVIRPNIGGYKQYKGYDVIPQDSEFRKNKKYILNEIPENWK